MNSSVSPRLNADLLDEKYAQWKNDPRAVEPTWSAFFEGFELGAARLEQQAAKQGLASPSGTAPASAKAVAASLGEDDPNSLRVTQVDPSFRARLVSLVYTYRAVGHTEAWIDPLSLEPPVNPGLDLKGFGFSAEDLEEEVATHFFAGGRPMKLNQMVGMLDEIYAGKIGFEFMHINDREVRHWLRDRIESRPNVWDTPDDEKSQILEWLLEAEQFESFLHKTYVAQKRFGLDGGESLMVALNGLFEESRKNGVDEIVMGMAHRGRLNVLANFLHKPLEVIFHEFSENYVTGSGRRRWRREVPPRLRDHAQDARRSPGEDLPRREPEPPRGGQSGRRGHGAGAAAASSTTSRRAPRSCRSCSTATPPSPARAWSRRCSTSPSSPATAPAAPSTSSSTTRSGSPRCPQDARSSVYCTDVAKMIEAPVFHVNGDCPLDVLFCAKLALEFRQKLPPRRRDRHRLLPPPRAQRGRRAGLHRSRTCTARSARRTTTATLFKEALIDDGTLGAEMRSRPWRTTSRSGWRTTTRRSSCSRARAARACSTAPRSCCSRPTRTSRCDTGDHRRSS